MKRFILTGAPGARKTAIIRQLELDGFSVVEEAATDIIALEQSRGVAESWKHPSFIDAIVDLQKRRQLRASHEPVILAFAGACALGSIYGFRQGAWPFGLVEVIWALVAARRWRLKHRR